MQQQGVSVTQVETLHPNVCQNTGCFASQHAIAVFLAIFTGSEQIGKDGIQNIGVHRPWLELMQQSKALDHQKLAVTRPKDGLVR